MKGSNHPIVISEEIISSKIYMIRNHKVMIDIDLSELYGVETKRLKEQVHRNRERFPGHFMFELTKEENELLRSQFATLKRGAFSKYLPYAFTEHGILMLSNVLKSRRAIEMSIKIIDIFVKIRKMLLAHNEITLKLDQLEKKVIEHDYDVQLIFKHIKQLLKPPAEEPRPRIGFRKKDEQ